MAIQGAVLCHAYGVLPLDRYSTPENVPIPHPQLAVPISEWTGGRGWSHIKAINCLWTHAPSSSRKCQTPHKEWHTFHRCCTPCPPGSFRLIIIKRQMQSGRRRTLGTRVTTEQKFNTCLSTQTPMQKLSNTTDIHSTGAGGSLASLTVVYSCSHQAPDAI